MAALNSDDRALLNYLAARLREALVAVERLQDKVGEPEPAPPPWDESDEKPALPKKPKGKKAVGKDAAEKVADQLNEIYPHGWSEAGKRRPPGLRQAAQQLRLKRQKGYTYDEIVDGCRRFRQAVINTPDQQYSKAMFRWIKDELWREIPEDVQPRKREPTPEEREAAQRRAEEARQRQLEEQAKRAGVQLDPETGKVVDWGPGGRPPPVRRGE